MTSAQEILIRLGLDKREVTRGLGMVKGEMHEFARDLRSTVAGAVGGYLTAEGIKSIIEYGEKISDTARRLGISAEAVQVWDYALKKNSSSIDAATGFFEKLGVARAKALGGQGGDSKGTITDSFKQLGVIIDDLKGKRIEDIAEQISDVFQAGDPQRLIGALREVGGRSAGELIPTLTEGIAKSRKEAEELGVVMSDEVVGKLKEAADQLTTVGVKLKTFFADPLVYAMRMILTIWEYVSAGIKEVTLGAHVLVTEIKQLGPLTPNQRAFYTKEYEQIGDLLEKRMQGIWHPESRPENKQSPDQVVTDEILRQRAERARLEREAEREKLGVEQQIVELYKDREALIAKLDDKEIAAVERERIKTEIVKNGLDITKKQNELKQIGLDLDEKQERLAFAQKERAEAVVSRFQPSIGDLAKSGEFYRSWNGQIRFRKGPFAAMSQEIERLEADAKNSFVWGNTDRGMADIARRDALRGSLEKQGIVSPERRLESIDEQIKMLNKTIEQGTGKIGVANGK